MFFYLPLLLVWNSNIFEHLIGNQYSYLTYSGSKFRIDLVASLFMLMISLQVIVNVVQIKIYIGNRSAYANQSYGNNSSWNSLGGNRLVRNRFEAGSNQVDNIVRL